MSYPDARKSHMAITEINNLHMTVTFREPVPLCRPRSPFYRAWKKAKKRPGCSECKRRMKSGIFENPTDNFYVAITFSG
jgi:hypothetical protein